MTNLIQVLFHHFLEGWWSTVENEIRGARRWQVFGEHFLSYEANSTVPWSIRLLIDSKVQMELVRVVLGKGFEFFFQENVIYGPVSKN